MDLCGGELSHSIPHPSKKGELLFLLFDFTHNLKNIYNNFVNKGYLHLPVTGCEEILGSKCKAEFRHIKQLYALEEDKTLKVAYALKKSSLNPSGIAKTSPLHALSKVFSSCGFHEVAQDLKSFSFEAPDVSISPIRNAISNLRTNL